MISSAWEQERGFSVEGKAPACRRLREGEAVGGMVWPTTSSCTSFLSSDCVRTTAAFSFSEAAPADGGESSGILPSSLDHCP